MDTKRVEEIKARHKATDTEELLAIWQANNRDEYVDEVFEAIRIMLQERGVALPEQAESISPEGPVEMQQVQADQKIEVEYPSGGGDIYNSGELHAAIINGSVAKSYRARKVNATKEAVTSDEKWSTVEGISQADPGLRFLYRPVWHYTLKFMAYGALGGIALKSIDTALTFVLLDPLMGVLWILLIAAHLLSVKWGGSIPIAWGGLLLLSFAEGMPNLCLVFFAALLATALVGCLFGVPFGAIIGTIVGHLKKQKHQLAPDAIPEGPRPYILGIIIPLGILLVLIPLYLWLSTMFFDWLQQ